MFLYPNPASSFEDLTIAYHINDFESADVVIFDVKGQVVYRQALDASMGVDKIDSFSHVKNGTYLVSIITNTGEKQTMKLVLLD